MLTADFQMCYKLDLFELASTPGEWYRFITLLSNLPPDAMFHNLDTSSVMPRGGRAGSRNRPLNPGEYKPIERLADGWMVQTI